MILVERIEIEDLMHTMIFIYKSDREWNLSISHPERKLSWMLITEQHPAVRV